MNLRNLVAGVLIGGFVSALLFQFAYMMISPRRWVRSRYALKSGQISEEIVSHKWGRIRIRIIGFVGTAFVVFYVSLFVSHLRSQ